MYRFEAGNPRGVAWGFLAWTPDDGIVPDELGGFQDVREEVDGHAMVGLLGYAKPYWRRLTVGIAASMGTRLARLVPPLVVGAAIDRAIRNEGNPGILADLGVISAEPFASEAARLRLLQRLALIAAVAYIARSVFRFTARYLLQSTAQKIQRDLRNDTYDHMQHLSLDFFSNHQTGAIMSILNNDVNRLERFLNDEIRQIIRVITTVGGISIVLLYLSAPLALIAIAPVPIIGLSSARFLTWIEPKYKRIRETVARLNSRLENNIGGVKVIKAFDRFGFELGRVGDLSDDYHDEQVDAIRLRRAFFATIRVLTGVAFVGILLMGGWMVVTDPPYAVGPITLQQGITVGTLTVFFLFIRRMYAPMRRIGLTVNRYQRAKSSAERVFGILGHDPTIVDPPDPHDPDEVDGRVTFDGVSFSYDTTEDVLRGIDLAVDPGETIGLAGETGAGKSTLVKLVPRFYDVDEGTVRIDGVDVREYGLRALRQHVGIVEQNPYLFSGTVEENIGYGDLSTLDGDGLDERIVEAAEAAEAHEFVRDLPDGYDTQIGERGIKLSGGQRQRLAIARCLLNDPAIIVLDEATSDVDTETEELIQQSLRRLIADRTAFVIAHRLSTIQEADRIVVMDAGEIEEIGPHEELIAGDGTYADLWASQADPGRPPADD
ncbi:MAG: ATP-binding cassette subfamily B protein [Halobacteriales archaeon]|jgi:ATP-binding cassette subfamily B protein